MTRDIAILRIFDHCEMHRAMGYEDMEDVLNDLTTDDIYYVIKRCCHDIEKLIIEEMSNV